MAHSALIGDTVISLAEVHKEPPLETIVLAAAYAASAMPYPEEAVLHLLSGHIGGVNWRLTRFADDVPPWNVCSLCRLIPKTTSQLPCSHILCETCLGASRLDGVAVCPLDQEPYEQEECHRIPIPARKANSLKAHCWNEQQGCEFVGTMEAVLRHYEQDCTFQAVQCPRCGDSVLHKYLATHYMAGCVNNRDRSRAEEPPMRGDVFTIHDVNAALEELKVLLRDPHHDQLLAIQSQFNELIEHSRKQRAQVKDSLTRELEKGEVNIKHQVADIASNFSSQLAQELQPVTSLLQPTSAAPNLGEGGNTSTIPWSMEKKFIHQKLLLLANASFHAMEELRHCVQPRPSCISLFCERIPNHDFDQDIGCVASASSGTMYRLTLMNAELLKTAEQMDVSTSAKVTYWDRRGVCFTVAMSVMKGSGISDTPCLQVHLVSLGFHETLCRRVTVSLELLGKQAEENGTPSYRLPLQSTAIGFCSGGTIEAAFSLCLDVIPWNDVIRNNEMKFDLGLLMSREGI
ncbi:uncharacterized protein LOC144106315 [Amblyomma americanum]